MKYLLAYRANSQSFQYDWLWIEYPDGTMSVQQNFGLVCSRPMTRSGDEEWNGYIDEFRIVRCVSFRLVRNPIRIKHMGVAGDSFVFSLPAKYHQLPQYHVHYNGRITQCILVDEKELEALQKERLIR